MSNLHYVSINRIANETFVVEASSLEEAAEKAEVLAKNHDWSSCGNVIYEIVESGKR